MCSSDLFSPNIIKEEWNKFVFICAAAGLCCLTRLPMGQVLQFKETKQLYINTMIEIIQIARKKGVDLDQDLLEKLLNFSSGFDPKTKPSMLHDLENGKRIEIEILNGAVVRFGWALEVPTPTNELIYACLKAINEVNLGRNQI